MNSIFQKKIFNKNFYFQLKITFRFDRPINILITNDESPKIENREDNCEKKISISLFSPPPHIKQIKSRRSNEFLFKLISSEDKICSSENLS